MKVQQLYTGCLAEAAYYIESEGEAIIIDPLIFSTAFIIEIQSYYQYNIQSSCLAIISLDIANIISASFYRHINLVVAITV